jgi:hypothetical protein
MLIRSDRTGGPIDFLVTLAWERGENDSKLGDRFLICFMMLAKRWGLFADCFFSLLFPDSRSGKLAYRPPRRPALFGMTSAWCCSLTTFRLNKINVHQASEFILLYYEWLKLLSYYLTLNWSSKVIIKPIILSSFHFALYLYAFLQSAQHHIHTSNIHFQRFLKITTLLV